MNRGLVRDKPVKTLERSWRIDIHNRFDIEVIDTKTGEVKQQARAFNVICEGLWSQLTNGYFKYIGYGSGSGTPSESDTALFNRIASKAVEGGSYKDEIPKGICSRTQYITLEETESVGRTITEVGIYPGSSNDNLCTHAMLEDMNGNPISITKTETDIIKIYATVFAHWNPSGENGIFLSPQANGGSYYNVLDAALGRGWSSYRSSYGTQYHSNLCGSKGTTTEGGDVSDRSIFMQRDSATKLWTINLGRFATYDGNTPGGFGWVFLYRDEGNYSSYGFFVIDVRGAYEVKGESVGTGDGETALFSTKFDFPVDAIVRVDGEVQTSGVSVKPYPLSTNPFDYMLAIQPELHSGRPCPRADASRLAIRSNVVMYLYNPLHEIGLSTWTPPETVARIAFSNDFSNWSEDFSSSAIPEEYRHSKYIRISSTYTGSSASYYFTLGSLNGSFPSEVSSKNIVFDTPPAAGSVITIDYVTPFVPKDENHVYDLSLQIQLGEYSG